MSISSRRPKHRQWQPNVGPGLSRLVTSDDRCRLIVSLCQHSAVTKYLVLLLHFFTIIFHANPGAQSQGFLSPVLYPKVTKLTFLENILFMLLCHLRCHDFRFCLSLKRLRRVYASNDCFPGKFAV